MSTLIAELPIAHDPPAQPPSLLEQLLREQQELTAVEQFAQAHASELRPVQARYYSSLMPATPPRDGEQYAFEVDLDACSGCKACVTACHALNGLDETETWRDVGLLIGGTSELPVHQHVTAACHHCLHPACLDVCPVDAYEKHPITGIVKHLDDQCIGCQYCTLACPYDVPKYNKSKGIVRKCDLCSSRLAVGEAPACVQACPQQAIRVRIVSRDAVVEDAETNLFLPGAPEPRHTLPTTTYKTRRVHPRNLLPADYYAVRPEHAHWPLVLMLVLTQLSVGTFLCDFGLRWWSGVSSTGWMHSAGALAFGLIALAASTLHLGRPLYAFRAVIGLRHSWLSREILAFGLYAGLAALQALAEWIQCDVTEWLRPLVVLVGLTGVFCSVMIYDRTGRALWSGLATGFRFFATTLLLGSATVLLTSRLSSRLPIELLQMVVAVTAAKLLFEVAAFRHLHDPYHTSLKRSALLMSGVLRNFTKARFIAALLSGIGLPLWLISNDTFSSYSPSYEVGMNGERSEVSSQTPEVTHSVPDTQGSVLRTLNSRRSTLNAMYPTIVSVLSVVIFAGCLLGELLERSLFFTAVVAPRMPGGLTT